MRAAWLLLLPPLLLAGCLASQAPASTPTPTQAATPQATAVVQAPSPTPVPTPSCAAASARFGDAAIPEEMLFSGKYNFSLQVFFDEGTCGESEPESLDVTLKEGNRLYGTAVLSPVEPLNAVAFEWFAEDDAVHNLTAALSAPFEKTKSGFSVSASPLGFFPDGEGISVSLDNNRKLAGSFEVENAVRVKSVELKMRRLRDFSTGEFLVQIRPDAGGKPGGDEETGTRRGISILPSSTGAVRIDLPPGSALQPGRHWLVVAGMSSESFEIEALNATVTGGMQAVANPLQAGAEDWKPWSHALFFKVSGLPS